MANRIVTGFGGFAFSSQVNSVTVYTDDASVVLTLERVLTGLEMEVFSETYYPINGRVTLHDLASIIEEEMSSVGNCFAAFRLKAASSSGTASSDFNILYCDRSVLDIWPGELIRNQFLMSRRVITVTRDFPVPVCYIRPPMEYIDQELLSYHVICRLRDTGETKILFFPNGYSGYGTGYEFGTFVISHADIMEKAASKLKKEFDLLGLTIDLGRRSLTILYSDIRPDLRLCFSNMFNCVELAELRGDTTTKTKVKRSEAHCSDSVVLYDQSVEQTFEFEADGLSLETANWLSELLASRDVRLVNRPYGDDDELMEFYPPVLITDSTSEIQDGDDELNKVKFTYRHISPRPDAGVRRYDRTHNDTFKNQFT